MPNVCQCDSEELLRGRARFSGGYTAASCWPAASRMARHRQWTVLQDNGRNGNFACKWYILVSPFQSGWSLDMYGILSLLFVSFWAQICAYVNKLTLGKYLKLPKSTTLVMCWAFFLAGCASLLLPLWSCQTTRGFCYLQRACFCTLLGFMLIVTHPLLAAFRYIFNRQRMIMIFSSSAKQQNVKLPPSAGWRSGNAVWSLCCWRAL